MNFNAECHRNPRIFQRGGPGRAGGAVGFAEPNDLFQPNQRFPLPSRHRGAFPCSKPWENPAKQEESVSPVLVGDKFGPLWS